MTLTGVVRRLTDEEHAERYGADPVSGPVWTLGSGVCAGGCGRRLTAVLPIADAAVAEMPRPLLYDILLARREYASTCADCRAAQRAQR